MFYHGYYCARTETAMYGCKPGQQMLRNVDWLNHQPHRCYFYKGRDCPGWAAGGQCSRIGDTIPEEETS